MRRTAHSVGEECVSGALMLSIGIFGKLQVGE
jgi:hypothetical protein